MPDKTFRAKILRKETHGLIVTVSAPDPEFAKAKIIDDDYFVLERTGMRSNEGVDEILEIEEE